jgi:hypothetical protein
MMTYSDRGEDSCWSVGGHQPDEYQNNVEFTKPQLYYPLIRTEANRQC